MVSPNHLLLDNLSNLVLLIVPLKNCINQSILCVHKNYEQLYEYMLCRVSDSKRKILPQRH